MATYTPTTTSFTNGVVTIKSEDSTTYDVIQESISGSHAYRINCIYLKANQLSQVLEPISFRKYDSNGNQSDHKTIPAVDPFSYQNSIILDIENECNVLDGKLEIDYKLLPNETVYFYLSTTVIDNGEFLKQKSILEEAFLKTYGYFDHYEDEIVLDLNLQSNSKNN